MSKLILDSIFFYYPKLKVLKGVYLEVERGRVTCLIGRNGSGKSTLFNITAGQLQADSGLTHINGHRFHGTSKPKRFEYIAYLPQKSFLPKSLKVRELINESGFQEDQIIQRIKDNMITDLSSGEQRYVEIMFVLSLNRDFVLLDEPFTGLAPIVIERIIEYIQKVKQTGTGVFISDHYMRFIMDIGDEFYLLENGQAKNLSCDGSV